MDQHRMMDGPTFCRNKFTVDRLRLDFDRLLCYARWLDRSYRDQMFL